MAAAARGETVVAIERRAATIPLTRRVERLAAALKLTPHVLAGDEKDFARALLTGPSRG